MRILQFRITPWRSPRSDALILLFLALLMFVSGLGLRDPWPADEPRFALAAKEMVESGQWFFPHRGDELYPDKPPVFMWTQAAFYALTGSIRVAFLLPSLFASLISLFLVWDLARRLWNRRVAMAAGLTLLATIQFTLQAKTAQIDAMLAMWTTLGFYGLARHMLLGPAWRWYYIGFAAAGLGVITKGVGILVALVLIPYWWGRRRGWRHLAPIPPSPLKWWLGPVVMLAAIALWVVPMIIQTSLSDDPALHAYRDNILLKQTAERYASAEYHYKPFWYYVLGVIPWAWLPVSAALPWLVPAWRRRLRRADARYLLPLGWIVLIVLFFSFSPSKRGVYMLPAVAPLALAAAPLVPGLLRKLGVQRSLFAVTLVLGLVVAGAGLAGLIDHGLAERVAREHHMSPWILLLAMGSAGLLWSLWARPRRGAAAWAGYMFTLWAVFGWWLYPQLNPARSSSYLMKEVGEFIGPRAQLGLVGWREQTLLQADRPAKTFGFLRDASLQEHDAARWLLNGTDRWLLLQDANFKPCFDPHQARPMGHWHSRDWYLVNAEAVTAACGGGAAEAPMARE